MILREATIQYKGYDPYTLSHGSGKKICCSCDNCGRVRWVRKQSYHKLCHKCSIKRGNEHSLYKIHKIGKDALAWKGGEITLVCKQCGNEYQSAPSLNRKFCSRKCRGKWVSENLIGENSLNWKGGEVTLICQQCGKKYQSKPAFKSIFCSNKCHNKWMHINRIGNKSPAWKGGISNIRDHILPINQCNCLNKRFEGSNGHHFNKNTVIFIPKDLHKHLYHNLKNGQGMEVINLLALQFINGGLMYLSK